MDPWRIMACFFGLPLDRQGFGPGELSNALASALRPADAFDCPDVQGQISSPAQYLACFSETRVLFLVRRAFRVGLFVAGAAFVQ